MKNMRKKVVSISILFLLMIAVFPLLPNGGIVRADQFDGGSGTAGDPYQVTKIEHLWNIRYHLDKNFSLMNDLDFQNDGDYLNPANKTGNTTGSGWLRIGSYPSGFAGTLNGNNHTISHLFINRSATTYQAFFGYIKAAGTVKNLGLINVNVKGKSDAAGLVGMLFGSVINSYVTGNVTHTADYDAGGLVGWSYTSGSIVRCHAAVQVTGLDYVGGLIAMNDGSIEDSYATGKVTGTGSTGYIGGLVGYNDGSIERSYATGNVTGKLLVGGLVGIHDGSYYSVTISDCYATGSATRSSGAAVNIGGFAGYNNKGSILNSYSIGSVHYAGSTDPTSKGFVGAQTTGGNYADVGNFFDKNTSGQTTTTGNAVGKTTAEMQTFSTFSNAGWDIQTKALWVDETWFIDDGADYPRFGGEADWWPVVTTNASTGVKSTNATLWGYLSDDGGVQTTCGFWYDTDSGAPYANNHSVGVVSQGDTFSYNASGLTAGQLYFCQTWANNSAGLSNGTETTFLTKPNPPTGLTITNSGSGQQTISWTHGTGYNQSVLRGKKGSYPSSVTDGTFGYNNTGSSTNNTGLTAGDTWYYRVWEYSSWGSLSQYSDAYAQANKTAQASPTVTTNTTTGVKSTNATLNGFLMQNGSASTTCGFWYDTDSGTLYANNHSIGVVSPGDTFSYNASGLTAGQLYYARAWANNSIGLSNGTETTFLTKPKAPDGFSAQANSTSAIFLSWSKGDGANRTYIEYNQTSEVWEQGQGIMIYNDTGTMVEHTNLSMGVTYYYQAWSFTNWTTPLLVQWSDENASAHATTKRTSSGHYHGGGTLPQEIIIYASAAVMTEVNSQFNLSLSTPFYARDSNGDGRVDIFVDPHGVLRQIHDIFLIDGHSCFLISTDNDSIPEFFWDTDANTIILVTPQIGVIEDTIIDTTLETVTVVISVEKNNWVYIEITDQFPPDIYPDYTLIVKTSDGRTIPSDKIWRENGKIYVLDDAATQYRFIFNYDILPPSFQPADGTTFTITRPTIYIAYYNPVTISTATIGGINIVNQLTTTDHKNYTFTPAYDLGRGTYILTITASDESGHILTSTSTYFINPPEEPAAFPWHTITIIIIACIISIGIILVILAILRKRRTV